MNSVIGSSVVPASVVFFSTLAGVALAKLRFRGANALMLIIILTMMVPTQLGLIPLYLLMVKLGWTGTLQAVIVPVLVQGFRGFLIRPYARSAGHAGLIHPAPGGGCSTWRTDLDIGLPGPRPAAARARPAHV